MEQKHLILIGAPVDCGKRTAGCLMGPDAYRTAGLPSAFASLGHRVTDIGNLSPEPVQIAQAPDSKHFKLAENVGWTRTLAKAAEDHAPNGFPVFMGGDHALALGTVSGMATHAQSIGRPLFVLWLDAHSDFHTMASTDSGNLHGTPVAYFTGRDGFDDFPPVTAPVPAENICMIGLRSVDPAERLLSSNSNPIILALSFLALSQFFLH